MRFVLVVFNIGLKDGVGVTVNHRVMVGVSVSVNHRVSIRINNTQ